MSDQGPEMVHTRSSVSADIERILPQKTIGIRERQQNGNRHADHDARVLGPRRRPDRPIGFDETVPLQTSPCRESFAILGDHRLAVRPVDPQKKVAGSDRKAQLLLQDLLHGPSHGLGGTVDEILVEQDAIHGIGCDLLCQPGQVCQRLLMEEVKLPRPAVRTGRKIVSPVLPPGPFLDHGMQTSRGHEDEYPHSRLVDQVDRIRKRTQVG